MLSIAATRVKTSTTQVRSSTVIWPVANIVAQRSREFTGELCTKHILAEVLVLAARMEVFRDTFQP